MSVRTHAKLPEADKSIRLESGDSSGGVGCVAVVVAVAVAVEVAVVEAVEAAAVAVGGRKELEQRDGQRIGIQGIHYYEQTTITPRGIHSPKS